VILQSLRLHNWRQFRGSTPEIHFGGTGNKPITVFFGTNGAGKTAILNAFTWTLYDSTTRGFLFPDQIVNKAAIREAHPGATVEGWVELKFEHLGNKYSIRKTERVRRGQTEADSVAIGTATTELQWCGIDGRWKSEPLVADSIGRILPGDLHTYFFFDGERIERIVTPEEQERADIANATKKLFGLEVLERAIRHVNGARKTLEKELKAIGDAQTVALMKEKEDVEAAIEQLEQRAKELTKNIAGHRAVAQELEERLRKLQDVKAVQLRRDQLNAEHAKRTASLKQLNADLSTLLSGKAYAVYLDVACQSYKQVIEEKRSRGELPAGIKRQFVEDILARNLCICDRSLSAVDSADARRAVSEWLGKAGLGDVEEKAIRMGGEVKKLELQVEDFWKLLDQFEQKRVADREELSRIQTELESISDALKNSPQEEVSDLERRLTATEAARDDDLRESGSVADRIKEKRQRLTEIDAAVRKHKANEAKQEVAQQRVEAAQEVLSRIEESKGRFEVAIREMLLKHIKALFDVISYTPYVPEIAEDYSLLLRESAGGAPLPVAASQGESQILSLCFIGAVISFAREYQAKKDRLTGPDSIVYPIVMDSPFGSLGPTYRMHVADHITKLADQVVVMVSPTQWRGEVEQSLTDRIGHGYVLEYYSPKQELAKEVVMIGKSSFDLIKASPNEYEYTKIIEVNHG
jgi:DNA sulfur modification protein DndD